MSPFHDARDPESGVGNWLLRRHLDPWLLLFLLALCGVGTMVLYSATGQDAAALTSQMQRLALGLVVMFLSLIHI